VLALCEGAVIVAHAAWWDVTFLEAELARLGQPIRFPHYLDTLTLARRAIRAESHSLEALGKKLGISTKAAHRAGEDVRSWELCSTSLVTDLAPLSPRDLWHVRVSQRHARPEIVERCLELAATGEPACMTYRPSHKGHVLSTRSSWRCERTSTPAGVGLFPARPGSSRPPSRSNPGNRPTRPKARATIILSAPHRTSPRSSSWGSALPPLGAAALLIATVALTGCPPSARGPGGVDRSPVIQKWLDRAKASYTAVDLDDASDSIKSALQISPNDVEVRTWGGRVALARLDFAETVRMLKGINTTDAAGCAGAPNGTAAEVDQAADELESMLQDPEVHDGWAKAIAAWRVAGAVANPSPRAAGCSR